MKRNNCIITLLIVSILLSCLAGCSSGKNKKEKSFVVGEYTLSFGTYKGDSIEYEWDDVTNQKKETHRDEIILKLNSDNTYELSGEKHKFTVVGKDIIIPDLNNMIMFKAIADNKIELMVGAGVELTFVKASGGSETKKEKVKITVAATKNIEYEKFDNGNVSMDIPKGWNFTAYPGIDNIHYNFMVQNPNNTDYCIFFCMKYEGGFISKKEKDWYKSAYGAFDTSGIISKLPIIDPQTTEAFYKIFNEVGNINNTNGYTLPVMNDFTKEEVLGNNVTGGEIIRANYINGNGNKVDGVFTTTIKPVSLYYITMLNMYNTIFFTAPDGELTNWEQVLNHCVSTINFSDSFVNGFYSQEKSVMESSAAISKMASETSNIITSGWNARQSTYDIISQKQSDATLGYERVFDTETNEIYKAPNGWYDTYSSNGGERYKMIDENMYNSPIDGYIE